MTTPAWTFGNLRADEKGLKPMPIEGAAASKYTAQATSWWGKLGLPAKIGVGALVSAVVLTIIIVPIVVATSGGDDDDTAATAAATTLAIRVLNYTAACESPSTLNWRLAFAAAGSSNTDVPTWQGTMYIKVAGGTCVTTPTVYAGWPMIMGESMTVPTLPTGYTGIGGFTMHNDTATGNLHLLSNGCVTYYYDSNTADAWWQGIDTAWKVVLADGSAPSAVNPCVAP